MQLLQKKTTLWNVYWMFLQQVNRAVSLLRSKQDLLRCEDGTEFDTHFSSLSCSDCEGLVSSVSSTEWSCSNCKKKKDSKQCGALLEKLDKKLKQESENADYSKESVIQFEQVIPLARLLTNNYTQPYCADSGKRKYLERSSWEFPISAGTQYRLILTDCPRASYCRMWGTDLSSSTSITKTSITVRKSF